MSDTKTVIYAALALLVFGLVGSAVNYFSGIILIKSGQGMSFDLRNELFKKVSLFSF